MIDGAVVPLPEEYHASADRATRWFRNGLAGMVVGLIMVMLTSDGQT
jgi:hypothetical protein